MGIIGISQNSISESEEIFLDLNSLDRKDTLDQTYYKELEHNWNQLPIGDLKIKAGLKLLRYYKSNFEIEKQQKVIDALISCCEETLSKSDLGKLYHLKAQMVHSEKGIDEALIWSNKSVEALLHSENDKAIWRPLLTNGILQMENGSFKTADSIFNVIYDWSNREGDLKMAAYANGERALIPLNQGNVKQGLKIINSISDSLLENLDSNTKGRYQQIKGWCYSYNLKLDTALYYFKSAYENLKEYGESDLLFLLHIDIADTFLDLGRFDESLSELERSKKIAETLQSESYLSDLYVKYAEVYLAKSNLTKSLDYLNRAEIHAYNQGSELFLLNVYSAKGKYYKSIQEYSLAKNSYLKMLDLAKGFNSEQKLTEVVLEIIDLQYQKDSMISEVSWMELEENLNIDRMILFDNIESQLLKSQNPQALLKLFSVWAKRYEFESNHPKALAYTKKYINLKDSLLTIEKNNSISKFQEEFSALEKEKQILTLEKSNAVKQKNLVESRNQTIWTIAGLLVSFLMLIILMINKRKIQGERKKSEKLLLNVLPEDVALELKTSGSYEARIYENASVLFADFVGFTKIGEQVSPKTLIECLDTFFKAFDSITQKYNVEKIKTIGDAYMAASGLKIEQHPDQLILAAIEMLKFTQQQNEIHKSLGLPSFKIRIGIHTGPVIAGIVGRSKFAFDIWGDTVNIASRLESNGEPGKINVSEETYSKIKNRFLCSARGLVEIKNKGAIPMYFIKHAI